MKNARIAQMHDVIYSEIASSWKVKIENEIITKHLLKSRCFIYSNLYFGIENKAKKDVLGLGRIFHAQKAVKLWQIMAVVNATCRFIGVQQQPPATKECEKCKAEMLEKIKSVLL